MADSAEATTGLNITLDGEKDPPITGVGGVVHCPTANNGLMKCTSGYCCPNQNGCCINYMELWWFWCLWIIIIAFSCFCAYHHHKVQSQPRDRPQVPYVATCSYPGPPVDGEKDQLGYCKLPKYDASLNVHAHSSPPPPYRGPFYPLNSLTSIFTDSWNSFFHSTRNIGIDRTQQQNDRASEKSNESERGILETRQNLADSIA